MKKNDLLKMMYSATIYAKDLKAGMRIIDDCPDDDSNVADNIFEIAEVHVSDKVVSFRAIFKNENNEPEFDYTYDICREPEEPTIVVFFTSTEEGMKYGIDEKEIQIV